MAANLQVTFSGLARALVQAGKLQEAEAEALVEQAASSKTSFIEQVVASHKLASQEVALFAAETFGYPFLDLGAYDTENLPKDAIEKKKLKIKTKSDRSHVVL